MLLELHNLPDVTLFYVMLCYVIMLLLITGAALYESYYPCLVAKVKNMTLTCLL